jgi:hypothetical protein
MPSPKEFRAAIVESRAQLQEALHGAHESWERKPQSRDEEDAWSPRQVAEHAIGSEWFFTNAISQACGAPALDRPSLDVSSPATAAATATRLGATCDNILRHVSDQDLEKTWNLGSQLGTRNVAELLTIYAGHLENHVNQLKAASA